MSEELLSLDFKKVWEDCSFGLDVSGVAYYYDRQPRFTDDGSTTSTVELRFATGDLASTKAALESAIKTVRGLSTEKAEVIGDVQVTGKNLEAETIRFVLGQMFDLRDISEMVSDR